jgi:Leucine-rich repeat (LRR) protein
MKCYPDPLFVYPESDIEISQYKDNNHIKYELPVKSISSIKPIFWDGEEEPLVPYKKIEYLDLSYRNIKTLDFLNDYPQLIELDLSHNKINKLSSIRSLKNLRKLNLSYNQLVSVCEINYLSHLEYLDLSHNPYLQNTECLAKLKQLDDSSNDKGLFLEETSCSFNPDFCHSQKE